MRPHPGLLLALAWLYALVEGLLLSLLFPLGPRERGPGLVGLGILIGAFAAMALLGYQRLLA